MVLISYNIVYNRMESESNSNQNLEGFKYFQDAFIDEGKRNSDTVPFGIKNTNQEQDIAKAMSSINI